VQPTERCEALKQQSVHRHLQAEPTVACPSAGFKLDPQFRADQSAGERLSEVGGAIGTA
jgi:hypothetical protein